MGRQVENGSDLLSRVEWAWCNSPWEPRVRDRLPEGLESDLWGGDLAGSSTNRGRIVLSLKCLSTSRRATPLIRRWRRRHGIEDAFRTLTPLLAADACQVHREAASYEPLVVRLSAGCVLLDTTRVVCKGRMTMEAIVLSLKHDGRVVNSEVLVLQGLS